MFLLMFWSPGIIQYLKLWVYRSSKRKQRLNDWIFFQRSYVRSNLISSLGETRIIESKYSFLNTLNQPKEYTCKIYFGEMISRGNNILSRDWPRRGSTMVWRHNGYQQWVSRSLLLLVCASFAAKEDYLWILVFHWGQILK